MSRITLEGKLLFATAVVGILTLVLTASALLPTYESYRAADDNLNAVQRFKLVLEAASTVSSERGPSNDIMAIEPGSSKAAADRLSNFRRSSDLALAALETPSNLDVDPSAAEVLDGLMWKTRDQLQRARTEIDRIAETPLSSRRQEDIQLAIDQMIGLTDLYQGVIDWYVTTLTVHRPSLTAPFLTGRIISDLREYAGRAGSQIFGPVATRKPLEASHLTNSSQTMGRLLELRQLLHGQLIMSGDDPFATQLMNDVDTLYFGTGIRLLKRMISEGRVSGNYSISGVGLTRFYVPTFKPIEKLRSVFLDETIKRYKLQHDSAFHHLVTIFVITLFVLLGLLFLSRSIRLHVLNPLLMAQRQIISLADGNGMSRPCAESSTPEMASLFDALEMLQGKLRERAEYEVLLKMQADKDGLTGIWNRRALEAFGHTLASADAGLCLLLIDIDHFKRVNDTHGHLIGDAVLIEVAGLLQAEAQPLGTAARFGGEEFAVLLPHSDLHAAFAHAERLREAIRSHIFRHADMDIALKVTASIGVAVVGGDKNGWRQVIADADQALYRAKKEGRNRTCVFESSAGRSVGARAASN